MQRNRYYWTLIGILGIVAETSDGLELTSSSIKFPNGEEISGDSIRLLKTPIVKDGDGNVLGKLVGLGYYPGSTQVDILTDQGYVLRLNSSGALQTAPGAYGGPIYGDAQCQLEEFVINAMQDIKNPPPIVKMTQQVYEDNVGNPVYIRKDAVPASLVYYAFRINEETNELECQLVDDDLTEHYSNWSGLGAPPPQVIDILPNDPSVTGFPGVAGQNYPLTTPIKVEY